MKTKKLIASACLAGLSISANAYAADIGGYELKPYLFGTVGAVVDGVKRDDGLNDNATKFAGQVGLGTQIGTNFGAELTFQTSTPHSFESYKTLLDGEVIKEKSPKVQNNAVALRATVGSEVKEGLRLFGKVGVAANKRTAAGVGYRNNRAYVTAGVGMTYSFNDEWSVRADYDHYFKRNPKRPNYDNLKWKGTNYAGIGFQYNF